MLKPPPIVAKEQMEAMAVGSNKKGLKPESPFSPASQREENMIRSNSESLPFGASALTPEGVTCSQPQEQLPNPLQTRESLRQEEDDKKASTSPAKVIKVVNTETGETTLIAISPPPSIKPESAKKLSSQKAQKVEPNGGPCYC